MTAYSEREIELILLIDESEKKGITNLLDEKDFDDWLTTISWQITNEGIHAEDVDEEAPLLSDDFELVDVLSGAKVGEFLEYDQEKMYLPIPIRKLGDGFLGAQLYINETDENLGSNLIKPGDTVIALKEIVRRNNELKSLAHLQTPDIVHEMIIDMKQLAIFMGSQKNPLDLENTVVSTLTHKAIVDGMKHQLDWVSDENIEIQNLKETASADQLFMARRSITNEMVRVGAVNRQDVQLELVSPYLLVMPAKVFVSYMETVNI